MSRVTLVTFPAASSVSCLTTTAWSIDTQVMAGWGLSPATMTPRYLTVLKSPAGTEINSPTARTSPSEATVVLTLVKVPAGERTVRVSVTGETVHFAPVHQPSDGPEMSEGTKSMSVSVVSVPRTGTTVLPVTL